MIFEAGAFRAIASAVSSPFIPGIIKSIKITSGMASPRATLQPMNSTAACPEAASLTSNPQFVKDFARIRRFVELSSTTSAGKPFQPEAAFSGSDCDGAARSGISNQNVEPSPGMLLIPIWPPINSTNCLLMAKPSPVPPKRLVVEESSCEKAWNNSFCRSSAIPGPVSRTQNRNRLSPV